MGKRKRTKKTTPRRTSKRIKKRTPKGIYYDENFEECTLEVSPPRTGKVVGDNSAPESPVAPVIPSSADLCTPAEVESPPAPEHVDPVRVAVEKGETSPPAPEQASVSVTVEEGGTTSAVSSPATKIAVEEDVMVAGIAVADGTIPVENKNSTGDEPCCVADDDHPLDSQDESFKSGDEPHLQDLLTPMPAGKGSVGISSISSFPQVSTPSIRRNSMNFQCCLNVTAQINLLLFSFNNVRILRI